MNQGVITSDRTCLGCGYALRGLPLGGQCPECGTPIRALKNIDDPLSAMPVEEVRSVRNACWLGAACTTVILVALLSQAVLDWIQFGAVAVATAGLWVVAVLVTTGGRQGPQAAWHGLSERHRARVAARWLSLAWLPYAVVFWLVEDWLTMPVAVESMCEAAEVVTGLAGVAGVVVFALVMQRLAEWVRDDTAEKAFVCAVWLVPIAALILHRDGPAPGAAVGLIRSRIEVVLQVVALIGVAALPFGMLSLARSLHYAVIHAETEEDRAERRAERQRRDDERVARAVRRMDRSRP